MDNVENVARYIIRYGKEKETTVSNLKLQKLLYFLWVDFYKKTKKYLFNSAFYAWQFGPVIPEIYYKYCVFGGNTIREFNQNELCFSNEYESYMNEILENYIYKSAYELVEKTHSNNKPWVEVYKSGLGHRNVIPFELIIKRECAQC